MPEEANHFDAEGDLLEGDMVARMAAAWDVVGIGANSIDLVNLLPAWPRSFGEFAKVQVREQLVSPGGQVATAMATCGALGLRATYVGAFGKDEYGSLVRAALQAHGVDISRAVTCDAPTRSAVILIDGSSGERIVLWHRADQLRLAEDDVPQDLIASARLVHVDDEEGAGALRAARVAREHGIPVTSDLDRATAVTRELLDAVSLPIFAEHLPAQLTGESDHERALRQLRGPGHDLLVTTLGARGAAYLKGDHFHVVPGFRVDAVDTTGSGDVFRGAFIYGLLHSWPVERSIRFANAAAAVSCTRRGAFNAVPRREEVEALLTSSNS